MKKSKKIILILTLLLVALTIGIGGYTYAKYTTSVRGGGQVDVAKWSFKVNNNSEQLETIRLIDTVDETRLVNGKIAPGTRGEFTINIDGTGTEVGIDYFIKFENEQNKPTNLTYTYEGQKFKSLAEIEAFASGAISADESNKTRDITIEWEWDYETGDKDEVALNDEIDTQEGIANLDYTFDVKVTGTQVHLTVD